MSTQPRLTWSKNSFECAGTTFVIEWGKPKADEFWIAKHRWMVERYEALVERLQPQRILELGVYSGGSTAFLSLLAQPVKLMAIDLEDRLPGHFDAWLRQNQLDGIVSTHFGVDQSDVEKLQKLVNSEFGSHDLDLVIDDASHLLEPSIASFNLLFPRLRPGGVYVLEDWSWQLAFQAALAGKPDGSAFLEQVTAETPMSRLVLEIILASTYGDIVDDISVRGEWMAVTRGSGAIDKEDFNISVSYPPLGRELLAP